jgi:hypothetical protein
LRCEGVHYNTTSLCIYSRLGLGLELGLGGTPPRGERGYSGLATSLVMGAGVRRLEIEARS